MIRGIQRVHRRKQRGGRLEKVPLLWAKVWDGPHGERAPGFIVHVTQKISGHAEKEEWKIKFEKDSWKLGTQV